MANKVRIGIIGLGAQGSMYAKIHTADGMVLNMAIGAICDVDPAKAEVVRVHIIRACPSMRTTSPCSRGGDVDAVVACVPHYLHPQMGIDALQTEIFTSLVEKPAGVYTRQVKELNEFAATKPEPDLRHHVQPAQQPAVPEDQGDRRRWRRSVHSATPTGSSPPGGGRRATTNRASGGPPGVARAVAYLVNQAPHQLDLWQWICGGAPSRSTPRLPTASARDIAVEDEVTAVVDYGDGATGVFITAVHDLRRDRSGSKSSVTRARSSSIAVQDSHSDPAGQGTRDWNSARAWAWRT